MDKYILLLPILFPLIMGAFTVLLPFKSEKMRNVYVEAIVIINSILVYLLLFNRPEGVSRVFHLTNRLVLSLRIDGMSMIFAGLVAVLWPLATLYAFEYMEHEERRTTFFAFYTMTFGITVGIAFSANFMTMYLFYEMLTLITLPLVMHKMDRESRDAARKYMVYSITGAAFAFIGFIFIFTFADTNDFILGGVLDSVTMSNNRPLLLLGYVMTFMGFGVKAAVFPLCGWLPKASVAPTPVTALLHAVAVVKAGAFTIIRITYYSFGADNIRGTWAQYFVMSIALITILYGSSMAVKETHIKRRLAYSTISNLSYILFGATIMTPLGMIGALSHLVMHAVMKIVLFCCAGAVMEYSHKNYIPELNGVAKKMPFTMTCFTVASLAVLGIPPLAGFISKWNLGTAAIASENKLAYVGVIVLMISAVLTAIYLLTFVIRAFWPPKGCEITISDDVHDPGLRMKIPFALLTILIIVLGVCSGPLMKLINDTVNGLM